MKKMYPVLDQWQLFLDTRDPKILDEILDEEVVFHSPVLWTPQKGKYITTMYLMAAMEVLGKKESAFRYLQKIVDENQCALEFETTVEQIVINGVDLIQINESGKIICFKVMIRPLKAVNKLHEKMMEQLSK